MDRTLFYVLYKAFLFCAKNWFGWHVHGQKWCLSFGTGCRLRSLRQFGVTWDPFLELYFQIWVNFSSIFRKHHYFQVEKRREIFLQTNKTSCKFKKKIYTSENSFLKVWILRFNVNSPWKESGDLLIQFVTITTRCTEFIIIIIIMFVCLFCFLFVCLIICWVFT